MIQFSVPSPNISWHWPDWQKHLDAIAKWRSAIAAVICALLLLLGWFTHHLGITVLELPILGLAYVIGGYESTKAGLTTLIVDQELDVDLLMMYWL